MAILTGRRLGPYDILSPIGAGGMGEVYRARDTRLDRIVAIKVLPDGLADKRGLRDRFDREARVIASLNHPHICVLHDIGHQDPSRSGGQAVDYLVMEYLEGETLAAQLQKGPLPLDQALAYAIQIADALDKAHRKGVTHRDLKPGNIMITKGGAKLLDFGLAKLQPAEAVAGLSAAATVTSPLTGHGTILGTLLYMAPEQVEGRETDARSDIFSFGAIVYEMATGRRAFDGKSQASVIAAILEREPPAMSALQPLTPPALDRAVQKCLRKDPDERWQSARDVTDELKWIAEGGSHAGMPAATVSGRKHGTRLAWAVAAGMIVIAAIGASLAYFRPAPAEVQAIRFSIGPPEKANFTPGTGFLALSPDGSKLAFTAGVSTGAQLWIRALDALIARPLPGTDRASQPFWSADSHFVAFSAEGNLKKIAVSGGPAQTITAVSTGISAGTWSRDGVILFSRASAGSTIERVSAAGGTPTPVTTLDSSGQETGHGFPYFLPDGKHFLYFARNRKLESSAIYVGSLDSKERALVLNATSNAAFVPPGHLLFNRQGTLMAQPFDVERLQLTSEAVPIAEGVQFNAVSATFAASQNGVLAYRSQLGATPRTLAWVGRSGTEQPISAPAHGYQQPRLSPDGRRIALEIEERGSQIWLYDLARETLTRLTFEGTVNSVPVWTPDARRITFYSNKEGPSNLFWQNADGTGGLERLTTSPNAEAPMSWSPDGQLLAFTRFDPANERDMWVLRLADRKAEPFLRTPFVEGGQQFSPDGRWAAYVSNESGRAEIYVQPYPGPGGKWQISTQGGTEPMWNHNGRELFYRSGNKMMAVEVTMQQAFSAGKPAVLFDRQYVSTPLPQTAPFYDVSADGQRFLM
jgi:Tol biopolymer transport system component